MEIETDATNCESDQLKSNRQRSAGDEDDDDDEEFIFPASLSRANSSGCSGGENRATIVDDSTPSPGRTAHPKPLSTTADAPLNIGEPTGGQF